jgi:hypothetical protein
MPRVNVGGAWLAEERGAFEPESGTAPKIPEPPPAGALMIELLDPNSIGRLATFCGQTAQQFLDRFGKTA